MTRSRASPSLPLPLLLPPGLHWDPADKQDASPHELQEQTRKPGQAWQAVQTAGSPPISSGSFTLNPILDGRYCS